MSQMDQILVSAAQQLEKQLDSEIGKSIIRFSAKCRVTHGNFSTLDRLESLNSDDIEAIRARRIAEMKKRQEKTLEWKRNVSCCC